MSGDLKEGMVTIGRQNCVKQSSVQGKSNALCCISHQ